MSLDIWIHPFSGLVIAIPFPPENRFFWQLMNSLAVKGFDRSAIPLTIPTNWFFHHPEWLKFS